MNSSSIKIVFGGLFLIALIVGGAFFALNSDDEDKKKTVNTETTVATSSTDMPLNLSVSLAPLEKGVYEGWVVQGEEKLSFGTFNTNAAGEIVGNLDMGSIKAKDGDTIAISIEPDNDPDPAPSDTIVLAGEIANGSAKLKFPVDISGFSGRYILGTPTTATQNDETAGVWFTTSGSDASLNLPVAPKGWAYEGWAVVDGKPYTTGLFTDPAKADFFNGYSGPGGAPNKPGEDFVANLENAPLDLRGATIVVSLEPYQNGADPTGDKPAQVKPLSHNVPANAADHSPFNLVLSTDSLPSGSASL